MSNKITDNLLAKVGVGSLAVATYFLSPKSLAIPSVAFLAAVNAGILFLKSRWVESEADEWLLIIRDGKLIKAGIGLKAIAGLSDTVVKFPSKIEKVTFSANNVTKEMQGIEITGFAFWSVYREEDGPFRCYKYMQGNDANENVRALCESVVRAQIANSSLSGVLKDRKIIRDAVRRELKDQFKGWGVWL